MTIGVTPWIQVPIATTATMTMTMTPTSMEVVMMVSCRVKPPALPMVLRRRFRVDFGFCPAGLVAVPQPTPTRRPHQALPRFHRLIVGGFVSVSSARTFVWPPRHRRLMHHDRYCNRSHQRKG